MIKKRIVTCMVAAFLCLALIGCAQQPPPTHIIDNGGMSIPNAVAPPSGTPNTQPSETPSGQANTPFPSQISAADPQLVGRWEVIDASNSLMEFLSFFSSGDIEFWGDGTVTEYDYREPGTWTVGQQGTLFVTGEWTGGYEFTYSVTGNMLTITDDSGSTIIYGRSGTGQQPAPPMNTGNPPPSNNGQANTQQPASPPPSYVPPTTVSTPDAQLIGRWNRMSGSDELLRFFYSADSIEFFNDGTCTEHRYRSLGLWHINNSDKLVVLYDHLGSMREEEFHFSVVDGILTLIDGNDQVSTYSR